MEERKKRLEERKRQRKEDRRNAYYRQKEEEAQRIHEEQLKRGNVCLHYEPAIDKQVKFYMPRSSRRYFFMVDIFLPIRGKCCSLIMCGVD